MAKNLLIVESPAKAKTIEKYLGKDFKVKSSYGHVRDLPTTKDAIDIENQFQPKYVVTPDKHKVVKELKDWVNKVDTVWLATDEDREGEAISWHLCKVLGLDEHTTKRIVFREITKPAVQKAILNPRTVDLNLVDAQQARRILDRLVGFELSGLLWKKIKGNLSAGRVQSVAVKLVVEKEREIQAFESKPFYRINAQFSVKDENGRQAVLKADLPTRYDTPEEARQFLERSVGATYSIKAIEVKPLKRKPAPPFTTSTLQQEASRKLGFAVKRTMSTAQRLYEGGFISYMRTDSTALSDTAVQGIVAEITSQYGQQYVQTRKFSNKKDAQEAHEAVRPTDFANRTVPLGRDEQRLYDLIWKRAVASQMADAVLEKTTARIGISTQPDATLNATGQVIKFDGFLKVYLEGKDDEDDEDNKDMLPPLTKGQELPLIDMTATERFTRPPSRYTEASLVKKLEELGIGRPSTYAPTISKIMEEKRGYVVKLNRDGEPRNFKVFTLAKDKIEDKVETEMTGVVKNRLSATDTGLVVTEFLNEHFKDIMDYGFTADFEQRFDKIADGQAQWPKTLDEFYGPFHDRLEDTLENAERATGERILGVDPESGKTVLARLTKFGKAVQIGKPEELGEDEKARYANLRDDQSIETVTLEEALDMFQLPKMLGEYKDGEVSVGAGRYGPYVKWGDVFISIGRGKDPLEVDMAHAQTLIDERIEADRPVLTFKEKPVTKGVGRFGPFLKWDGMFINIPKRYDPDNLTQDEMIELIEAKIEKEANRYIKRWPEDKLAIENGRWGPFIRWVKKSVKLPKNGKERMTPEQAAELTLEEVKDLVRAEYPTAFKKKAPAKKKKAPAKKKATAKKKPAARKVVKK